jgi:hypothetical protein
MSISRKVPKKAVGAWSEAATNIMSLRRVVSSARRKEQEGVYAKLLLEFVTLPCLLLSLRAYSRRRWSFSLLVILSQESSL